MSDIVDVINSVGFPIFAVIALFWQNTQMRTMFDNEQKDVQKAIQDNTIVLTRLTATLDDTLVNSKGDEDNEPTKQS